MKRYDVFVNEKRIYEALSENDAKVAVIDAQLELMGNHTQVWVSTWVYPNYFAFVVGFPNEGKVLGDIKMVEA